MTDEEFNEMKWKQERSDGFAAFKPQSEEGRRKEKERECYDKSRPCPSEYNGPF